MLEVDEIKGLGGDNVVVTMIPIGNSTAIDDVTITRQHLATDGPSVPRGRATTQRTVCRGGQCFLVSLLFATEHPSDRLIDQVNRILSSLRPA